MLKYLNDIKEKDLLEIRNLASMFFSIQEISEMLEIDFSTIEEQMSIKDSPIYKAYKGGNYDGQIMVRTGIIKMAKAGSTPAQAMAMDLIKKLILTE